MTKSATRVELVTYQIGDYQIGGPPGEHPTALMLSIFHQRDRLVTDTKQGLFNKTRAQRYIDRACHLSETTGSPFLLDVLAETPTAMVRYLEFITQAAEGIPFLIDSSSEEARVAGVKYVAETGLADIAIYDSINQYTTPDEIIALRSAKITAAILLAHNPKDIQPMGRLTVLKGSPKQEGLLAKATQANVTKPLIDTAALDLAGLSIAAAAFRFVKDALGLPVGAGSGNSVALWKHASKISPAAKRYLAPALISYLQCHGANFVFPGTLRHAPRFFTTASVTDALRAYTTPNGTYPSSVPKTRKHPRYTVL